MYTLVKCWPRTYIEQIDSADKKPQKLDLRNPQPSWARFPSSSLSPTRRAPQSPSLTPPPTFKLARRNSVILDSDEEREHDGVVLIEHVKHILTLYSQGPGYLQQQK
jgi:hypothetical protein